jgi:chromosomal replication initiator protein
MAWIRQQVSPHDRVLIEVPNPFFIEWFEQHSLTLLRESFKRCLGSEPAIKWSVRPDYDKAPADPRPPEMPVRRPDAAVTVRSSARLNPRYLFENFVVGPSNAFTHAAAQAIAKAPGQAYNPLFIYGSTGLGKTHLMQAIGNRLLTVRPSSRVAYVPCENFTNELIEAISQRRTHAFREKYRNLDVLLIDDIHFLSGREATQEEFFHTFNTLHDAGKQIIVTCDSPPREIQQIEVRLVSRFNWGLVTDIGPPDLETRIAILQRKAQEENITLPDDVAYLISSQVKSNIRVLEGCLVKLAALSRLLNARISQELAQDVLRDVLDGEGRRQHSPESIQEIVAEVFGVAPESLRGKRRTARIARARQVAMYLTRNHTHLTLMDIGRAYGHRDHSTVLHACGRIARLRVRDAQLEQSLQKLETRLRVQEPPHSRLS